MKERVNLTHAIDPVYDAQSRILMLGTMPSPKSRESGFFYGHPQNRFWRVLACVLNQAQPASNEEKIRFLLKNHIALWDVLRACDIAGADDASIRNPAVNDFSPILAKADIRAIFTTGAAAYRLYQKYAAPATGTDAIALPSTSPANCAQPLESLIASYQVIKKYLSY